MSSLWGAKLRGSLSHKAWDKLDHLHLSSWIQPSLNLLALPVIWTDLHLILTDYPSQKPKSSDSKSLLNFFILEVSNYYYRPNLAGGLFFCTAYKLKMVFTFLVSYNERRCDKDCMQSVKINIYHMALYKKCLMTWTLRRKWLLI